MNHREFEELLHDVEVRLERMKALYEQYFQGMERVEPLIARKEVERRMQQLRRAKFNNTQLRFRFQMLVQRYTSYQTYWKRVARQIEEGTYRRDVLRARRRRDEERQQRSQRPRRNSAIELEVHEDDAESEVAAALAALQSTPPGGSERSPSSGTKATFTPKSPRPTLSPFAEGVARTMPPSPSATFGPFGLAGMKSEPRLESKLDIPEGPETQTVYPATHAPTSRVAPRSVVPRPSPVRSSGAFGVSEPPPVPKRSNVAASRKTRLPDDASLRRIYDQYVDARKNNHERTDHLSYESVRRSVKTLLPKLQEKYKGKDVDFKVVVKNGKVGLKPSLK